MAVVANTSPGDISHSDGHSIFKVQVLLQEQFSEKMRSFPYIQEVGKERKTGWISTLRDRKKEGYAMQVKLTIQERLKDLRVERGLTLEQLAEQTGLSKSALGKYQVQLQDAMNFAGSDAKKQARIFLTTFGIDYDAITKEQFINLIEVLKLSKHMKSPANQWGKAHPYQPHGKGKRKRN